MNRDIVVGIDGSAAAEAALELAGQLARDAGAKLQAVYVREEPAWAKEMLDSGALDAYWEITEWHLRQRGAELLDPLGVAWTFETRAGDAAAELADAAAQSQAGLLVVGGRGKTVQHRLLLGSVAARLVASADRPVLIAR